MRPANLPKATEYGELINLGILSIFPKSPVNLADTGDMKANMITHASTNTASQPPRAHMASPLSTTDVARLLHVAAGSVANWIDQGRLKAGRTPGGHRRVEADDLVAFLRRQNLPIPPELVSSTVTVLIVDDEEAVARWIADEIAQVHPDYEILQAHDGFSAGELVGSVRPDAVILDLRMPGMDGYEVCRYIKSKEEARDTAIIAITAYHSPEAEERILACGADVLLTKPLDPHRLRSELDEALSRRR